MSLVLVDSSVWIDYFRAGDRHSGIDKLIDESGICTNDLILSELFPYLLHKHENELIQSMQALERIELSIDWDMIIRMQVKNFRHGINRVGIPDLIILQNVIENDLMLYAIDRHFFLMKEVFDFPLFDEGTGQPAE